MTSSFCLVLFSLPPPPFFCFGGMFTIFFFQFLFNMCSVYLSVEKNHFIQSPCLYRQMTLFLCRTLMHYAKFRSWGSLLFSQLCLQRFLILLKSFYLRSPQFRFFIPYFMPFSLILFKFKGFIWFSNCFELFLWFNSNSLLTGQYKDGNSPTYSLLVSFLSFSILVWMLSASTWSVFLNRKVTL